ncbi:MAG: glycosyltransferase [Ruminococcaceae bacterium]|nr:glycosyltransferase [Oscillospiraceae bacterium]
MKILQINCVYNSGSTGKIVYDISNTLKQKGFDSVVCYGRGKKVSEPNVYKVSTEFEAKIHSLLARLFGVQFGFSPIATAKTINIIKKEKPDVVHLHCLNGNFINVYRLLDFLKNNKIKTVLTLHAEIMHTAGCEHAFECEKWKKQCHDCKRISGKISRFFRDDSRHCFKKMKDAFQGFDNLTVVGVSDWLTQRAKLSPVFEGGSDFKTVNNGLDTDVFKRTAYDALYEKYGIPKNRKIVLYVTPNFNHAIKGGKYVLEVANRLPDYQFVIVGFNGDKSVLPKNILPIARTDNKQEMAMFYSIADITLLTSLKETFSMIVAESLCCGTPVVGFEAGAPETITIKEYSSFTEQGNIDILCKQIEEFLSVDFDKDKISTMGQKKYSFQKMADNYIVIYN